MKRSLCVILLLIAGYASYKMARPDAAPLVDAPAETAADAPTAPVRGTGACSHIEIAYFVATPASVDRGTASTLSWDGGMARGCDLQPDGIGFGGGPLSFAVTPSSTTEYSLRCFGTACLNGTTVARVTVTVR